MSKITIDLTKTVKEIITTMKKAIDSLQDQLTFDTTPTDGSSNPVTSGGIKTALDTKLDKTGTAVSATKLQTARTINFNGALDGNITFDGSKDVSVTLSEFNHTEAIIDLTDATKYDTDTYYLVVSNAYWDDAEHKYRCWTPIHTVKTAPWGTFGTGGDYSAELKVKNNMYACGARKSYAEILMNSCIYTNKMPITYIQMVNCGRSVFFVRGGGKYWFSSTRNATWELKTDTFTENGNTVAPTKTYFTPESKNIIKTIGINISGNATKANQDALGNVIADTYAKKSEIPSAPVKGVKINGSTSNLTPDTSGIVTIPAIPTKVSTFTNDAGYLTEHQDLSGYQTKLTFDSTPTANSSNPVTSAGIKAAIDAKTVDLSNYYTKTQVDTAITNAIASITDGDSNSY